jgi:8-oxo-dGTP diphosphatase
MSAARERFKLIPAVYLVLRRDNEVLLHKRSKNASYQPGMYGLVAGHLDGDELATTGLVRESFEEAGVTVKPEDLQLVHTSHRLCRDQTGQERMDLFFETRQWQGEVANKEPEKCDDLSWFPIDNLPKNTIPLVRSVLNDIGQGIHYSEYANAEPANS